MTEREIVPRLDRVDWAFMVVLALMWLVPIALCTGAVR